MDKQIPNIRHMIPTLTSATSVFLIFLFFYLPTEKKYIYLFNWIELGVK